MPVWACSIEHEFDIAGSRQEAVMTTRTRPGSAALFVAQARAGLRDAAACSDVGERFTLSHLAGLRAAAAVLADRGRPASARRKLVSVWVLIDAVAPEFSEWADFFAAGAPLRAAIECGAFNVVTQRQADDQMRAGNDFLALVEDSLGMLATPLAS
jgi:hypothetical protein